MSLTWTGKTKVYVISYASRAAFPIIGSRDTIYIDDNVNALYWWNGLTYEELGQYPAVDYYADLPAMPDPAYVDKIYRVRYPQGIRFINYKPAGFYASDGITWDETPITAGAITYSDLSAISPLIYNGSGVFSTSIATNKLVGRYSALTGVMQEISLDPSTLSLSGAGVLTAIAAAPSGAAGGDLSSTYPNPTVAKVNGALLGTTSVADTYILMGNGTDISSIALAGDVKINSGGTTVIGSHKVLDTMLRQSAALSIIGNATNALADVADIAGTANQVLRVNSGGTALAFGQLNLASSNAVTGTLPQGNGGTGFSTYALGDILYSSATNTLAKLAGNITTAKQYLSQTGNGSISAAPAWATIAGSDITGAALTKTDDTNVTLTLGGTPTTALLRATSLTLGWTGLLSLARGGTNANLTASNGGIFYSTSSAAAILAGTATANQLLISGSNAAPSWTSFYKDYGTANPTTTGGNLFIGTSCGSASITDNDSNTGIGVSCLSAISASGSNGGNTAVGFSSLASLTSGAYNTSIGYGSGFFITTGSNNTFCGLQSGGQRAAYSNCSFFGWGADASVSGLSNASAFGYNASESESNSITLGDTNVTKIKTAGALITTNTTASSSTTTGCGIFAGGVGVAGKGYFGGAVYINTTSATANLVVSGGVQNTSGEDSVIRAISSSTASKIELQNTTASTGKLWELRSLSNGNFDVTDRTGLRTMFSITTTGNIGIGSASGSYGGGVGVMFVTNATTVPTTNPSGGPIWYAEAGASKTRGPSSTITTFGVAEPHCGICGMDFAHEWENEFYGGKLQICNPCKLQSELQQKLLLSEVMTLLINGEKPTPNQLTRFQDFTIANDNLPYANFNGSPLTLDNRPIYQPNLINNNDL